MIVNSMLKEAASVIGIRLCTVSVQQLKSTNFTLTHLMEEWIVVNQVDLKNWTLVHKFKYRLK